MIRLFLLLFLASCVTKGRNFPADLAWIKKGETVQKDVLMVLGTPFMVGNSGGVRTWSYGLYHYRIVGRSYVKELKFFWSDDNTVRDYSFQSSFPDDLVKAGLQTKKRNKKTDSKPDCDEEESQ